MRQALCYGWCCACLALTNGFSPPAVTRNLLGTSIASSRRSSAHVTTTTRSSAGDGPDGGGKRYLDPFELRGQTAPDSADLNAFELREQARTQAMLAEINGDEELKLLFKDPRIKGLIILLRNLNPYEVKEVFEQEYGNDEFIQGAKDRIFRLMDKYR
ncbi:hypothetical protein JKP88DRAFT_237001 [Tribonema minus]|uniref:RxLR effector protein n=1 Tax=Tribonema minus TaxID=303371 RepID=A0A835Z2H2_9STRA|nr:hypothetical protein JKP88DRAFT_237001 [Tribonema minus]